MTSKDAVSAAINALLTQERISQATLASRAGVSQPTVSRAARGLALGPGPAKTRLLAYLRDQGVTVGDGAILSAVNEIWDGSEAHAAALAHLVRASRALWPDLQRGVQ
jgi:transcriptional regulator with XRE-family HTH domain